MEDLKFDAPQYIDFSNEDKDPDEYDKYRTEKIIEWFSQKRLKMKYKIPPLYLRHTQSSRNKIILNQSFKENQPGLKRKPVFERKPLYKIKN